MKNKIDFLSITFPQTATGKPYITIFRGNKLTTSSRPISFERAALAAGLALYSGLEAWNPSVIVGDKINSHRNIISLVWGQTK